MQATIEGIYRHGKVVTFLPPGSIDLRRAVLTKHRRQICGRASQPLLKIGKALR